jgi:hypothetical protein
MAKTKTEVKEEVETETVAEVEVKAPKAAKNSATVTWRGNSRTYTRELHGENFRELADEFAEKKGGEVA